ncbi:MAG: hypothetical protein E1N59_2844 [Puniceicoccaceae bacterium 5H]|nr:MAG: hypothetical protein E1N59_2844 [Puniceicoccaceae bacterium 5H]
MAEYQDITFLRKRMLQLLEPYRDTGMTAKTLHMALTNEFPRLTEETTCHQLHYLAQNGLVASKSALLGGPHRWLLSAAGLGYGESQGLF